MRKNFKNLISPWFRSTSITNRVLSPIDRFTACLQLYEQKLSKSQISGSWVHRYHKSCSQLILTVLRVITIVWTKTSKMSYLREFSVEVSQIVFWRHLTVFRLFTTFWAETSKVLYLREFSPQVSQVVFSGHLTVFRFITTVLAKTSKRSYLREFSPKVSQIVFSTQLTVLRLVTTVWVKTFKIS